MFYMPMTMFGGVVWGCFLMCGLIVKIVASPTNSNFVYRLQYRSILSYSVFAASGYFRYLEKSLWCSILYSFIVVDGRCWVMQKQVFGRPKPYGVSVM